ncbi:hypothetical protein [Actinoplanes subglobosus]|uniref:Uncharacterized protein n=1 Tax=Actinoplanes subglobosus TaxID=1547892 RepID=A0ABV8IR73_9ACTN
MSTNMPDLSSYKITLWPPDAAYEWYLSDHPWAAAERTRRREAEHRFELDNARKVQEWIERTRASDAAGELLDRPDGWRDDLVGLAENMAPVVADNHTVASVESAEPDDLWVANARRKLENARRASGDHDYTYPAHLLGASAAAYPPPGWNAPQ